MSSESFKILKEISSLSSKRQETEDKKSNELKRLTFVQNTRKERKDNMDQDIILKKDIREKMTTTENQISLLSKKINKDQESLSSLLDGNAQIVMEKQISENKDKLDQLEEAGLEYLDQEDTIDQRIEEAQEFLKGSLESYNEIKDEVEQTVSTLDSEINTLTKRINLLKDELPPLFKDKLERTLSKNLTLSSFTRIKGSHCEFCKKQLTKIEITQIEDSLQLKNCTGCSRIFIPIQASY